MPGSPGLNNSSSSSTSKVTSEEMGEEQVNSTCSEAFTMEDMKLRRAVDLISTLIAVSYNVKVFPGKWKVIRTKLEELKAGLQAAENCQQNASLLNLLQTILQTVGRCHELATRCIDISYTGKLLMQSDLDLAFAKLDSHIRSLAGVYADGVLSNGYAIVVSRPGNGPSRDDLRFYVTDLATRMKIGDSEMKRQALSSLHELVMESEKSVSVVMEKDEVLCMLPKLLDSPEIEIQEESARLIAVICGFDQYKGLLVGAGIIPPLIRVSEGGSLQGKSRAVECLCKLTENSDNAWSIAAHGGVTALLNILLKCCTTDEEENPSRSDLIRTACGALRNLVGVEEIKRFMVEEGAIPAFIKLVKVGDDSTQISSIDLLQAMACGDESLGNKIVDQGGVHAMLLYVLDPNSSSSSYKSRESAFKAVETLCFSTSSRFQLLLKLGFVNKILWFLRNGDSPMQELSLKAAVKLCCRSEEAQKVMGETGFIPQFVSSLQAKSYEVRLMASEGLSSLLALPKNRKRLVQEDLNVGIILQAILDNDDDSKKRILQFLLSVLLAITGYSSVRRRTSASACFNTLQKLADSGVNDAKKIVRKVSSNGFQGMVGRILHFHG